MIVGLQRPYQIGVAVYDVFPHPGILQHAQHAVEIPTGGTHRPQYRQPVGKAEQLRQKFMLQPGHPDQRPAAQGFVLPVHTALQPVIGGGAVVVQFAQNRHTGGAVHPDEL